MKTIRVSFAVAFLFGACAQASELDDLRATVEQMQQSINGLKSRITELEKERDARPAPAAAMGSMLNAAVTDAKTPRTGAWTPDPRYPGYVPLPYTPFLVRLNLKPRLDFIFDNHSP